MSNIFFTSDTHFNHANIIKYSNRPFANAEEMNESIITNWNSRVQSDDTVWHLGDFVFGNNKFRDAVNIRRRLKGHINFIKGNHDPHNSYDFDSCVFESVQDYAEISVAKQRIVLMHYAMKVWNKAHHGAWHLYGHSHGTLPDDLNSLSFDVGVDCHNFFPLEFEEVKRIMNRKTWKPIDHHGEKTN